jgi:N-acetylmuramoyl-L-alanine amidase
MEILDYRDKLPRHPEHDVRHRDVEGITHFIIHHSLTVTGSAEAYANYHVFTKGWSIMGYTYVIEQDGAIKWCADHNIRTPHVGDHNDYCLGICLTGDFRTQKPTKEQHESLMWLIHKLLTEDFKDQDIEVKGHSDLEGYEWKPCPVISMKEVRKDILGYAYSKGEEQKPSSWAKEAWEWATKSNITDGKNPKKNITREQVVTMLHRYDQMKGGK